MELAPFDPAEYLEGEEEISAYLEDARSDGPQAYSRAMDVVMRARARMRRPMPADLAHLRTHAEQIPGLRVFASAGRHTMTGKTTSSKAASAAGKTLSSGATGAKSKSASGSALSQKEPKDTKSTGGKAASAASKTLSDGRTAAESKSAAGSALSQKKKS